MCNGKATVKLQHVLRIAWHNMKLDKLSLIKYRALLETRKHFNFLAGRNLDNTNKSIIKHDV